MNATAAAAVALSLSFTFEEIVSGLSAARPYAHRSRVVPGAGGITILDDCYNASPASMEAALATLVTLAGSGRRVAVLGDMLELGEAEESAHRELGRSARTGSTSRPSSVSGPFFHSKNSLLRPLSRPLLLPLTSPKWSRFSRGFARSSAGRHAPRQRKPGDEARTVVDE